FRRQQQAVPLQDPRAVVRTFADDGRHVPRPYARRRRRDPRLDRHRVRRGRPMKNAIQSLIILIVTTGSPFGIRAGEVSELGPSIHDALGQGYQFISGTGLGNEKELTIGSKTSSYHDGYLYLMKGRDIMVCYYTIVTRNPAPAQSDIG